MVLRAMIRPQQLKRSHLKIPDKKTPSNKLRHRFLSSQSTSSTLAASKPSATLSPVECRRVPNLYPSDGTGTCHDDHARRQIQCAVYCYTALAIPPIRSAASCAATGPSPAREGGASTRRMRRRSAPSYAAGGPRRVCSRTPSWRPWCRPSCA